MEPELIIIRSFRGRPIIKVVDSWDEQAVYVKVNGGSVGFPIGDAFLYDEKVVPDLDELYNRGALDWGKLQPWNKESGA